MNLKATNINVIHYLPLIFNTTATTNNTTNTTNSIFGPNADITQLQLSSFHNITYYCSGSTSKIYTGQINLPTTTSHPTTTATNTTNIYPFTSSNTTSCNHITTRSRTSSTPTTYTDLNTHLNTPSNTTSSPITVVIKQLSPFRIYDDIAQSDFDNEIQVLSRISHKNIVQMLGYGNTNNTATTATNTTTNTYTTNCNNNTHTHALYQQPFIILENLNGNTLSNILSSTIQHPLSHHLPYVANSTGTAALNPKNNRFTWKQWLVICKELAEALAYLHHGLTCTTPTTTPTTPTTTTTPINNNTYNNSNTTNINNTINNTTSPASSPYSNNAPSQLCIIHRDLKPDNIAPSPAALSSNNAPSQLCIIHRDLKPDNIAFTSTGQLKLLDFGMSICIQRTTADNNSDSNDNNSTNSMTGTYDLTGQAGSYRYMAPENAYSQPYNEKVDIYAYGLIIYECYTYNIPYDNMTKDMLYDTVFKSPYFRPNFGLNLDQKLSRHSTGNLSGNCSELPPAFQQVISRCWSHESENRPSAEELVQWFTKAICDADND